MPSLVGSEMCIRDRDQILDAVSILNRDYRLQNSDANSVQSVFSGMPADIEVEFALATKAPNGQCFSGITRTVSALTNDGSDGDNQVSEIISNNDVYNGQWAGNRYLNIFVCAYIGGAAGYTYTPYSNNTSMYNGIRVLHDYVGSIGTSGSYSSRTLTHEVGHWLNLEHTWGPNNNPGNATVTLVHSRSKNIEDICLRADILIVALGKANFVNSSMVKSGCCIIDVGITRIPSDLTKSGWKLVGDVDFNDVKDKVSYITPVPGGVGPMTIAMLLKNTLLAAKSRN